MITAPTNFIAGISARGVVALNTYSYGIGYAVGIPVSVVLVRYFAKRDTLVNCGFIIKA